MIVPLHFRLGRFYCVVFLALLAGCQQMGVVHYQIPFRYESLAAGNEGVRIAILDPEKEAESFSLALVSVLQEMEYSIVKPSTFDIPLPEKAIIKTDPVPLDRSEIAYHNSATSLPPIKTDALYRLSYSIKYAVNMTSELARKHFMLMIWSNLERRGAGGRWHRYSKPYSAKYFAGRLRDRIEKRLIDG